MLPLLALVACSTEPTGQTSRAVGTEGTARPSVLLVSLDTVGARHLSLYGGAARMPTLERFAAGAVVFDNAFAQATQTQPSHWVILTGQDAEVHRDAAIRRGSRYGGPTLAQALKSAGFATGGFIGGMTMTRPASGLDRGFDVYDDEGFSLTREARPAEEVVDGALRWIRRQDGPWFALVHLFDAHAPYTPGDPRRYDPDYTGTADGSWSSIRSEWTRPWMSARDIAHVRARYHAEVTELDAELGRLLAAVPDDTVVVVTADHGESFAHGYYFNHAEVVYDDVLHVPLVIRAPGIAPRREAALVGTLDITPTVLAVAGVPALDGARGVSLLPFTTGRDYVYARAPGVRSSLLSVRSRTQKAVYPEGGRGFAFDLAVDPGEEHPLLAVPPELDAAREAYLTASATDLARWPDRTEGLAPDTRAALEALGYVVGDR